MAIRKLIQNKHQKIVLWQRPNPPIIVWAICTVLVRLVPSGTFEDLLRLVGFGALFTWAWLEIFDGVNYFRRGLGVLVIVTLLVNRL